MNAIGLVGARPYRGIIGSMIISGTLLGAVLPGAAWAQADAPYPEPWQRADVPFMPAGLDLRDVIAGGPGFIAVGGGYVEGRETPAAVVVVSPDGYHWQLVELTAEAALGDIRAVTAIDDAYVAVGSGGPGQAAVWRSTDGLAWERLPDQASLDGALMLDVTATEGGLVAVGCDGELECGGGLAWTSTDGTTWSVPVPLDLLPVGVAATAAGVLALGTTEPYGGPAAVALEADGGSWLPATEVAPGGSLHDAADASEGIVAAGGATNEATGRSESLVLTSPDGQAWQPLDLPRQADLWAEDLVIVPEGWLLVGWQSRSGETRPATILVTSPDDILPIRFPRELKEGGLLHAAAIGATGETMVAVGSTVLNRGQVPAIWVRGPGVDSPA